MENRGGFYAEVKQLAPTVALVLARIQNQSATVVPSEPAEQSEDETPPFDDEDASANTVGCDGECGYTGGEVEPMFILTYQGF